MRSTIPQLITLASISDETVVVHIPADYRGDQSWQRKPEASTSSTSNALDDNHYE